MPRRRRCGGRSRRGARRGRARVRRGAGRHRARPHSASRDGAGGRPPSRGFSHVAQPQAQLVEAQVNLARGAPRPEQLLRHPREIAAAGLEQRAQVLPLDVGGDAREAAPPAAARPRCGARRRAPCAPRSLGARPAATAPSRRVDQRVGDVEDGGRARRRSRRARRRDVEVPRSGRTPARSRPAGLQLAVVARPVVLAEPRQRLAADEHREGVAPRRLRARPAEDHHVLVLVEVLRAWGSAPGTRAPAAAAAPTRSASRNAKRTSSGRSSRRSRSGGTRSRVAGLRRM